MVAVPVGIEPVIFQLITVHSKVSLGELVKWKMRRLQARADLHYLEMTINLRKLLKMVYDMALLT